MTEPLFTFDHAFLMVAAWTLWSIRTELITVRNTLEEAAQDDDYDQDFPDIPIPEDDADD